MDIILNQYDFTMSKLLKPDKVGEFTLASTRIPKGTIMRIYHREGRISKAEYRFDYPLVMLKEGSSVWMSDSQFDVESLASAVDRARGNVLISGLGIGLLPTLIKSKETVKHIHIVELHPEVIELVFHQIASPKMTITEGDIYNYLATTDKKYDFIHVDIWGSITAPLKEISRVHELAKRCLNEGGIAWCWLQELYDRIKDKLPKAPISSSGIGTHDPCLICGKMFRHDYAGLCMDCADDMGVSELYIGGKT